MNAREAPSDLNGRSTPLVGVRVDRTVQEEGRADVKNGTHAREERSEPRYYAHGRDLSTRRRSAGKTHSVVCARSTNRSGRDLPGGRPPSNRTDAIHNYRAAFAAAGGALSLAGSAPYRHGIYAPDRF